MFDPTTTENGPNIWKTLMIPCKESYIPGPKNHTTSDNIPYMFHIYNIYIYIGMIIYSIYISYIFHIYSICYGPMIHWWFTDLRTSKRHELIPVRWVSPSCGLIFYRLFLGKNRGNHGILPGNSWEKNMGKTLFFWVFLGKNNGILGKKHEKTWEHWKTLLVFLVFPVVRFSDIPWEVAHCFLTVSTKYSMVKKKQPMVFLVVRFSPQSSPSPIGRIFHDFPAMAIKNGVMAGKIRSVSWFEAVGISSPWQNNCGFSETTSIVNDS